MAQRAGHSVRADTAESPTAEAIVIPNCLKKVPAVPDMKVTGMKTAMNTRVVEIQAAVTSLIASVTALRIFLLPLSSLAMTASTTTIASSTTVPIASTRAKSVSRLRENPASFTMAKVPMSDTMMEMVGMIVALKSCRKKYTTSTTRSMAMTSVSCTLYIEAKRKSSLVSSSLNSKPAGSR